MGPECPDASPVERRGPTAVIVETMKALALLAAIICAVALAVGQSAAAHTPRPLAVGYRGPAGCPGCSEAVAALIWRSPLHFRVAYIGRRERRKLTAAGLQGATLYAQPRGNGSAAEAMRALGRQGAHAITRFVAAGGHYVGFCMGAYLAGSNPGMGLLSPGDTGDYDQSPGASVTTTAEAVIPVWWGAEPRYPYVQDPPYVIAAGALGERVLSRFTNGKINALVQPFHRGSVGVVGTHPEADRSWYTTQLWRADSDGLDYAQGLQLIAAVMSPAPSQHALTSPSGGLTSPREKEIAMELVSSAENSTLAWRAQFGYIEDIHDGRGYTGGIIGFTSRTGDMLNVVRLFTRLRRGNPLARFLPALQTVDGTPSHRGLGPPYVAAWRRAARDQRFQRAQEIERDRMYFDPAVALATSDGLGALGQFAYYDAAVVHGIDGLRAIRRRALTLAAAPARAHDEMRYLNVFLDQRDVEMRKEAAHSDLSRIEDEQRRFLREGNLDLLPPLRWSTYGDQYRILR